jgi:hypothetical protein
MDCSSTPFSARLDGLLVHAVQRALEVADALAHPVRQLRQPLGAEQKQHDEKDQYKLERTKTETHRNLA